MKLAHALLSLATLLAAERAVAQAPVPVPVLNSAAPQRLAARDVEVLVTPIALYPDPLVALILPASTNPADIVLAARFLERGGVPEAAASEPWDDSVKALVRYREVITYLDDNLEWTRSLGECFLVQPDDVMGAIQVVRARAKSSGLLVSTPQQEVIVEETIIEIVPAQPTVIYVPRYDPEILYVSRPSYFHSSFLSFGIGYGIGSWLNFDCDWRHRSVHVVHRPHTWYHQPDWRHRHAHHPRHNHSWTRWTPSPRHYRNDGHVHRPQRPVHTVMPGRRDRDWDRDRSRYPQSNPTVAAARSDAVDSWQGSQAAAPVQPEIGARDARSPRDRTRPPGQTWDRRGSSGDRQRPSTANGFAATPTPAPAAPVVTAPAGPRYERRAPDATRQPRSVERPQYRPSNPAANTQVQRPQPQRDVVHRPSTPAPQRVSAPPPQREVARSQPAPAPRQQNTESPRPARNQDSDRGPRSSSTERSPSHQHAY